MEELPREVFVPGALWVLSAAPQEEDPLKLVGSLLVVETENGNYLPVFTSDRLARGFLDSIPERHPDEFEPVTYHDIAKFGRLLDSALTPYLALDPGYREHPEAIPIKHVTDAIHRHLATQAGHGGNA